MSVTALKITKEDGTIAKVKFMTVWNPPVTDVDIYQCNDEFIPIGDALMTTCEKDEETYHIELRKEAIEKGQFVPEESTDPQFTPGYVEPPEENEESQ